MKLKHRFLTFVISVLLTCAAGVARAQTPPTEAVTASSSERHVAAQSGILDAVERAKEAQRKAFSGAWEGVFTAEAGGPPPFRILFTFGTDGTVVASDAGPPNPHLSTAEHGAWELTGDREFLVIYKQLLFDKDGNLDSLFKARVRFKLNEAGTEISGPVIVDFADPQGTPFLTGRGAIKCAKIKVEPLN